MLLQLFRVRKFVVLLVIINFLTLFGWHTILQAREPSYHRIVEVEEWDVLNIRTSPDHRSKKVGHIPPNEHCVLVIGEDYASNNALWFQISYKNTSGWVNSYFMTPSSHCD